LTSVTVQRSCHAPPPRRVANNFGKLSPIATPATALLLDDFFATSRAGVEFFTPRSSTRGGGGPLWRRPIRASDL
jgi:hypothetical protein